MTDYDITRGADDDSGNIRIEDENRRNLQDYEEEQAYEKAYDFAYFDNQTIIDYAPEITESGEFIRNIMNAYMQYQDAKLIDESRKEFLADCIMFCQEMREDTATYYAECEMKND